ncbi:hypothetical protein K438DRAFT_1939201 [Mycena galopus ATCC 62051]|nr:hypothetical protein K438DRAFT_1939201 [Mycena galopus ATCC 62051]
MSDFSSRSRCVSIPHSSLFGPVPYSNRLFTLGPLPMNLHARGLELTRPVQRFKLMLNSNITYRRHIRFARRFDSANAEDLFEDREGAGSANWPRLTKVPRRLQNGARGGRSRDQAASWLRKASCKSGREGELLPPPPPVPVSQIFHCPCFPDLSLSKTPTETFARRRGQVMVTGSHASSWTSTTTIYLAHKSGPQIILPGRFVLLSFKWFNAEANDVRHNYCFTHAQAKPERFAELQTEVRTRTFLLGKTGLHIHLLIGLLNLAQQPERDPTSVKLQHTRSSNKYTECATRWIFFLDCGGLGKQVWPLPKDAIGKFQSLWYYDHWLET